jgi:CheY-like chemotaxis protein
VHILIVEDDPSSREALEMILVDAGHSVCWAGTGTSAFELLRTEPVELILLDMMLPDMTGWEIARRKMQAPLHIARIPVIVVSGLTSERITGHQETSPMASVFLILSKPVDANTVLKAIDHIAELRSLETLP